MSTFKSFEAPQIPAKFLQTVAVSFAVSVLGAAAQQPAPAAAAPIVRRDAALDVAADSIGRALVLRCFCAENNLSFDVQGRPVGAVKATDWTLAAVNVLKVERKGPGSIELEGVRVAIKYAPDRHEFERHAQNDEKMRIIVADTGDPKGMERALEAVFSVGIDVALQRAMPGYWRRYFEPGLPWPDDDLSGQKIYLTGAAAREGADFVPPGVTHRAEASYTAPAEHDRVKGAVQLRIVVDAAGAARHVTITQPLGYGLDARAVEATQKVRFAPATKAGVNVPSVVTLNQEFEFVNAPR